MSRRSGVHEPVEEDANSRRRSTRIASVVTRRASATEETTPAKATRAKRLSLTQDNAATNDNENEDDSSSVASSRGRSTPKLQVTTRAASKSPQTKAKADEKLDVPMKRTRSRGSVSSVADEEERVSSPAPSRQTRRSLARSESPTSERVAAAKVTTPRKSARAVSASPTAPPVSKLRGRRPSVTEKIVPMESIEEADSASAKNVSTPTTKPRTRRFSATEPVVSVESSEEKKEENTVSNQNEAEEKDTKDSSIPPKKKKALTKEQNLQTISETSFVADAESNVNENIDEAVEDEEMGENSKEDKKSILNTSGIKKSAKSHAVESSASENSKSSLKNNGVEESEEERQLKILLNVYPNERRRSPRKSLSASVSEKEKEIPSKDKNVPIKDPDTTSQIAVQGGSDKNNTTAGSEESSGLNLHISESDVSEENIEAKTKEKSNQETLNVSGSSNTSDKENVQSKPKVIEAKASPKVTDSTKKKLLSEFNAQAAMDNTVTKGSPAKSNNIDVNKSSKDSEPSFYEPMEVDEYPSYTEVSMQNNENDNSSCQKKNNNSPTSKLLNEKTKSLFSPETTSPKGIDGLEKSNLLEVASNLSKSKAVANFPTVEHLETSEPFQKSPLKTSFNLSETDVLKIDISSESLDLEKSKARTVNIESPKLSSPIRRSARLLQQTDIPKNENIVNSTPKQKVNPSTVTDEPDITAEEAANKDDMDTSTSQTKENATRTKEDSTFVEDLNNSGEVNAMQSKDNDTNTETTNKPKTDEELEEEFMNCDNDQDKSSKAKPKINEEDTKQYTLSEKYAKEKNKSNSIENQKKKLKSNEAQKLVESFNDDEHVDSNLNNKIDDLIANQLKDKDSSDEESVTHFLDDMAAEGEEDTPSEGSNDIIDAGESVGSTESEIDSDESYELDSFIDDEDEEELLSGEEYDLGQEKVKKPNKKRARIIMASDSDDEEDKVSLNKIPVPMKDSKSPSTNKNVKQNGINMPTEKSEKMKNGIEEDSDLEKMSTQPYCGLTPPSVVSLRDSLSDNEGNNIEDIKDEDSVVSVLINKEDNLKSLEEIQQQTDSNKFEKPSTNKSISLDLDAAKTPQSKPLSNVFTTCTPNNSILENEAPESDQTARKRLSSITIQESISLRDVEEGNISDRISKVVDVFCSSVKKDGKDPSGNISLNISLDYLTSVSTAEEPNKHGQEEKQASQELEKETPTSQGKKKKRLSDKNLKGDTLNLQAPLEDNLNAKKRLSGKSPKTNLKPSPAKVDNISAYEQYKIFDISSSSRSLPEELQGTEEELSKKERKKRKRSLSAQGQKENESENKIIPLKVSKKKNNQNQIEFPSDSEMSEDLDKELYEKYSSNSADEFSEDLNSEVTETILPSKENTVTEFPIKSKKVKKHKQIENEQSFNLLQAENVEDTNIKSKKIKKHKQIENEQTFNLLQAENVEDKNSELVKKAKKKMKNNENVSLVEESVDTENIKRKTKNFKMQDDAFITTSPTKKSKKTKVSSESDYVSDEVFTKELQETKKSKSKKSKQSKTSEISHTAKSEKKHRTAADSDKLLFKPKPSNIQYFPSSTLDELSRFEKKKAYRAAPAPHVSSSNKDKAVRKPKLIPSSSMRKRKWECEVVDTPIKPSSSSSSKAKKQKIDYTDNFLEKDFRNRMLYDATRVKRMDAKSLLKKKQKMKYGTASRDF